MSEQYFLWDDDVPIRFDVTEQGQWVIDGGQLLEMARSVIWEFQQGDRSLAGPMPPQQAVESITSLMALYIPAYDTAILPGWIRESSPICDERGQPVDVENDPLCTCGHPVSAHQTGDGPWTGFCGQSDCDCEAPEVADAIVAGPAGVRLFKGGEEVTK